MVTFYALWTIKFLGYYEKIDLMNGSISGM